MYTVLCVDFEKVTFRSWWEKSIPETTGTFYIQYFTKRTRHILTCRNPLGIKGSPASHPEQGEESANETVDCRPTAPTHSAVSAPSAASPTPHQINVKHLEHPSHSRKNTQQSLPPYSNFIPSISANPVLTFPLH